MNKQHFNWLVTPFLAASLLISTASFSQEKWPDLPVGMKSGISAKVGSKLYVGLGSAGQDFYMLDLANVKNGWQKKADFSGLARSGATASVVGKNIYVFGGSGKNHFSDVAPVLFETVYRYGSDDDTWVRINTQAPVGLLGAASYSPDNKQVLFFGGYNKGYFDKYLSDINTISKKDQPEKWRKIVADYMGMKPLDYKWNSKVLSYTPETGVWKEVGSSPYLPNCGSALVKLGSKVTLVSGEIKPGLRTPEVKQFTFGADQPWMSLHDLPKPLNQQVQEGIAGAFAGENNGVVIVAGGANFHGAKGAFEQGKMFAHNGLGKTFNAETYVLKNGLWAQSTDLPYGLAHGVSFTIDEGVLVIGGEDGKRAARKEVYLLSWDGQVVQVTH